MPKHDWERPHYASVGEAYQAGEERVCRLCGARQKLEREYWWGRITQRRWRPLAGRCPGRLADDGGPRSSAPRGAPRRRRDT